VAENLGERAKSAIYPLGWSLTILGLVVVLTASLHYLMRSEELLMASSLASSYDSFKADQLQQERTRLHAWPGIVAGVILTLVGMTALLVHRRLEGSGAQELPADDAHTLTDDGQRAVEPGRCPHCGQVSDVVRERTWVDAWAERYGTDPELRERGIRLLALMEERDQRAALPSVRKLGNRLRAKMENGELPRTVPEKIILGLAAGELCAGCDEPILAAHVLNTLQTADGRLFHLHVVCLSVWKAARRPRSPRRSR